MKLKYAQELIKTNNANVAAGFNSFINGDASPKSQNYGDIGVWYSELQGYDYAKEMAKKEGVAFIKTFSCGNSNNCYPFKYGGFFVCNSCGGKGVDKEWWKIKVEKDGNAYCCHGLDFINLQESNNYAFGDTFEDAIEKYGEMMLKIINPD